MPNTGYTYRNRNTRDEVTYPAPSVRLDRLPNWERVSEPDPAPRSRPKRSDDQDDNASSGGDA